MDLNLTIPIFLDENELHTLLPMIVKSKISANCIVRVLENSGSESKSH